VFNKKLSIKSCIITRTTQKISYLCFPKEEELIEKWKVLCKENVNPKIDIYNKFMKIKK